MHSLRTRFTIVTVCIVLIAVITITFMAVLFIRNNEHKKANQLLLLLCETGEKNLDYYFNSVQKSVKNVAEYTQADIDGLDDESLSRHMERVSEYFDIMASKTNGVLTYYYRIDPEVSTSVKGFWYVDIDGEGFREHEVTDITQYDTADTSKLVWFTVPKHKGESIWLSPYITDNLDWRVISYNVPIYWRGQFVGVVGIEIDYSMMAEQVDSIRLYTNGYAFLSSANGDLFYHPGIDVTQLTEETKPKTPDGVLSTSTFFKYTFDGVEKVAAWLPLSNGMRLNVAVPVTEAEGEWNLLIVNILLSAVAVLVAAIVLTLIFTGRITKPIRQLTEAAEQVENGNYDLQLDYERNDELGRLTGTFRSLAVHMRDHIRDLNKQVYIDALTRVKNKGAFSVAADELQMQIDAGNDIKFAIGMFDCDDLKKINDENGHEKGDIYLKTASGAICTIFPHSPVFRIGGDEFAVILQNTDYENLDVLLKQFEVTVEKINGTAVNRWEQIHVSIGISEYDAENDRSVTEVVRRADKNMYENKRLRKKGRNQANENND